MTVPARIRANLAAREIDGDDALRAGHILATCPVAEPSWYEGVGHTPHLEAPERFNREPAALTRRARGA
jgi:pimeloyl-ACP methyl ester carboxylesterase